MNLLDTIWKQQRDYNAAVKTIQKRSPGEWMTTYVLGAMSELGQLLDSMKWKVHRLDTLEDFGPNVKEELADITKYVLSMWIHMGYGPEEMLEAVYSKGYLLSQMFEQDFGRKLNKAVCIFDLDNVLADTNPALDSFVCRKLGTATATGTDIHLDLGSSYSFDLYREAKNEWEKDGGYANLEPIYPIEPLFFELGLYAISTVVWTARPVNIFRRIKKDTFSWFQKQGYMPDAIFFGREDRITYALRLKALGHTVVMVEDDPTLYKRAINSGLSVIYVKKDYNEGTFNGTFQELVKEVRGRITSYEQSVTK